MGGVAMCAICGRGIADAWSGNVYFRVTGWERDRDAGGTNALRARERTGEVAHRECVDLEARGVVPGQSSLL